MSIGPSAKVDITLKTAVPTVLTAAGLRTQLANIGLDCSATNDTNLETYISQVRDQLPPGSVQCFDIRDSTLRPVLTDTQQITTGHWTSPELFEYAEQLAVIQYPDCFDWLRENRTSFQGVDNTPPSYSNKDPIADIFQSQFIENAKVMSSTTTEGLNSQDYEAAMSTSITPCESKVNYKPETNSRVLFLVEGYNEVDQSATRVGVMNVQWKLFIRNYKRNNGDNTKHKWRLDVSVRTVMYNDMNVLMGDFEAVKNHYETSVTRGMTLARAADPIAPVEKEVVVFDTLPAADEDSFSKGLPLDAVTEYEDVVVLYRPSLELIGSLDNTNSPASSSFGISVSKGFTLTSQAGLSMTADFQASAIVVSAGMSFGLSFSFTQSWNVTTTQTVNFSVPAGQVAYVYQGYLLGATLRYHADTGQYDYQEVGRVLSPTAVTSGTPLDFSQ